MRRAAAFCAPFLLLACGESAPPREPASLQEAAASEESLPMECALDGGEFTRGCTVEQSPAEEGRVLTLRDGEGGFRRLLQRSDGEIVAADGAEPASIRELGDGRIEVSVADDRYRFAAPPQ